MRNRFLPTQHNFRRTGGRVPLFLKAIVIVAAPILHLSARTMAATTEYYRPDGVRITHDPYSAGMADKYGSPGKTDNEGFDPYRDTVGPGIYGGVVKRDFYDIGEEKSKYVSIPYGKQYQNHNPRPGPIYANGGYTPVNEALSSPIDLRKILNLYPDLANDVSTGGAAPLHMCGMGATKENAVELLVKFGADLEALDTYGMTPLHRMASNNLAKAAKKLIALGADPLNKGRIGMTPEMMAQQSRARDFLSVIRAAKSSGRVQNPITKIKVTNSPVAELNGSYEQRSTDTDIPASFSTVCEQNGWGVKETWSRLSLSNDHWFQKTDSDAYIYWNASDGQWWIDGPSGLGEYIVKGPSHSPPSHGWEYIGKSKSSTSTSLYQTVTPIVAAFRERPSN